MTTTAIAMPRLGMTMEEGTVIEWPIEVGRQVSKGDIVLVIETEKAVSEIEATLSGILRHVYVQPDETAPCGALLAAVTESADEAFDPVAFASAYVAPEGLGSASEEGVGASSEAASASDQKIAARTAGERRAVAPAARAKAKKLGVDLARVSGSGPGGRVTSRDVEAFAASQQRLAIVDDGIGLEVLREGEGDPIVLLPGFGTDVSSFALQSRVLKERFAVLGVNPRGVGGSDAPELDVYEVGRAAEDVATLLDGPSHVVGASLGSALAIELALRHSDKVRSLTLLTPFVTARPRLLAVADAWCRISTEASPDTVAHFLAPWLFGEQLLSDDDARERTLRGLIQSVRRVPAPTLMRAAAGMSRWSGSREADLGSVAAPTLVLAAGEDLLTPDAQVIADALPNASCHTVAGCGHALAVEGADQVIGLLLEHLAAN
jgi:3-oxoadipate enol-lactonase